jgi:beta-hydroxylase
MAPYGWVLATLGLFAASSLYLHFRSRVRFKLRRQLADYSTLLAPYNAFACLFTRGGSKPVHDLARFPELQLLRDHWQEIRGEAVALMQRGAITKADRQDDLVFYSFMKRGWKRFYLKWYRQAPPSARAHCPRTVELLQQLPCVKGAMFTLLEPRSKLGKHRDPFAGTLRYHLGLATPNSADCRMQLDDVTYVWRDGVDILFDSSYVHSAKNETDLPRLVLFCDVHREMRGPVAAAINWFVVRFVVPMTESPNEPGDPVGLGNRVFMAMRPLRVAIAWLKRTSAVAYYGVKFGLAAAIVVLLLLLWR